MNLNPLSAASVRIVAASLVLAAGTAAVASAAAAAPAAQTVAQSDSASPAAGSPGGPRRHLMAQALMSVGLSDDQKTKIRGIMSDVRKQNESTNADQETRRANFKAAFAKIDAVMTPDQRTKFKAEMQKLRGEPQQQSGNS